MCHRRPKSAIFRPPRVKKNHKLEVVQIVQTSFAAYATRSNKGAHAENTVPTALGDRLCSACDSRKHKTTRASDCPYHRHGAARALAVKQDTPKKHCPHCQAQVLVQVSWDTLGGTQIMVLELRVSLPCHLVPAPTSVARGWPPTSESPCIESRLLVLQKDQNS